jgi:hypothetical protein
VFGRAFNGVLLAANMFTDEIPVVGEVTIAATGIYLAGDFIYHHWGDIVQFSQDIGNWEWDGVKELVQLGSDVRNWVDEGVNQAPPGQPGARDGARIVSVFCHHKGQPLRIQTIKVVGNGQIATLAGHRPDDPGAVMGIYPAAEPHGHTSEARTAVNYSEDRCALRWPLVGLGLAAPVAAAVMCVIFAATISPLWLIPVPFVPLFGPFLIYGGLLYRNWPTGIRIDEQGIRIGAVRSAQAARRTPP